MNKLVLCKVCGRRQAVPLGVICENGVCLQEWRNMSANGAIKKLLERQDSDS